MVAEKKQITRQRPSLSCATCRRRKVKCGKELPVCKTCLKAGEVCVYTDNGSAVAVPTADGHAVSRKRLEPDTGFEQPPVHGVSISAHVIRVMEQKLNQLSALVHDMGRLTPVSNGSSPRNEQSRFYAPALDPPEQVSEPHTTSAGSDYQALQSEPFSNDSMMKVLSKLDSLNTMLKLSLKPTTQPVMPFGHLSADSSRAIEEDPQHVRRLDGRATSSSGTMSEIPWQDMMAPSEEESNVLFRNWLWSVYPVFPLISPYLVMQKYEEFRKWYRTDMDRGIPVPDQSFMPFMLVLWLTAKVALSEDIRKKWFPWRRDGSTWYSTICDKIEQYLDVLQTDVDRSTWVLSASVMYYHFTSGGYQDVAKSNVRNLLNIRRAQILGLHSERTITQNDLGQAETRRRIWWEIASADASLSLNSGMPTLIEDCYTDTKDISDLKDVWLGTADAAKYQQELHDDDLQPDLVDDANTNESSSMISVFYLVMKARIVATTALRKILRVNMSARPVPMADLKELRKSLALARKQIENIIHRIPTRGAPELDFMPVMSNKQREAETFDSMSRLITKEEIRDFLRDDNGSGSSTNTDIRTVLSSFHKWARISLSAILDGLECASYAPFLRNSKSRLWAVSRNCALRVSHSFLRKYLSLAKATDLRRFRWTWPLLFNPMHAAIIMLVDVHERPHSDEAPRSRALIDDVFSLASRGKGVIDFRSWPNTPLPFREGGDEAWIMLRKLRHKAWHKAGLDPDVLWTEEEQRQVGIGKPLSENDLFIRSLREDIIMSHSERVERLHTSSTNQPDSQKVLADEIKHQAAKQYMHPSQLGPGERVTGSVTHSMVDWDATELPQVLLLRAQQDQRMMPFPPTLQIPNTATDNQSKNALFGYPTPALGGKDSDISHLGDLIRKIKQTQIDNSSNSARVHRPRSSTLADASLPDLSEEANCHFRTQQKAMDTALQELLERDATSHVMVANDWPKSDIMAPEASLPSTKRHSIDQTHRFSHVPFASTAMDQVKKYDSQTDNRMSETSLGHGGTYATHGPLYKPLMSEVMNRYPDTGIDNENPAPTAAEMPYLTNNPAAGRNLGNDSAIMNDATSMDFEFDWARWDEMFGTTQGFEDMMMDLASEELHETEMNHDEAVLG